MNKLNHDPITGRNSILTPENRLLNKINRLQAYNISKSRFRQHLGALAAALTFFVLFLALFELAFLRGF